MTQPRRVFLAHAREDKERVRALYKQIKQRGFSPWLDEEDLIPGQIWEIEIQKAIHQAGAFIACLSQISVQKKGFVQTEFRLALTAYGERPPEAIYFIPVRLDECEIPDLQIPNLGLRIRDFHWLDLWQEGGFEQLIRALEKGLGTTGRATSELRKGPLTPTPRPRERVRVTRREPSRDFIKEIGAFLGFGGAKEVKADDLKANVEKLKLPVEGLDVKVDGDKVTVFGKAPSQEIKEKVILALGNVAGVAKVEDHMDTPPGDQATFYTVQKGDTLSAIAKKQYGDPYKYNAIWEANKPMLTHPDKIYPGQVLRIPKLEAAGPHGLGGGAND